MNLNRIDRDSGSWGGNAWVTATVLSFRAVALLVLTLMAMAEPILAVILGALSFGCFFVAVLFGFVLHAPFQHRWLVLFAAVAFALSYSLFRLGMRYLERFIGGAGRRNDVRHLS